MFLELHWNVFTPTPPPPPPHLCWACVTCICVGQDAVTDMSAENDPLEMLENAKGHRGILQAAKYIKEQLQTKGILETAFQQVQVRSWHGPLSASFIHLGPWLPSNCNCTEFCIFKYQSVVILSYTGIKKNRPPTPFVSYINHLFKISC